jgi:tetratricopeptide (TPR) repeat protein
LFLFEEVKKNHYEVLGIPNTAAEAEIKRAYFGMVRKHQPDRFPEEFKEIRAAYETLMDPKKRAEYDAIGELPASVIPLFHEAQRFDRLGRLDKAAEQYQLILKRHPELDTMREHYARVLDADKKTGKAIEVWEDLCRRHPDNPGYAEELGGLYFVRGWVKKAHAEAERSLALDPSSIKNWTLLINCVLKNLKNSNNIWDELGALVKKALEAVKDVKTDEWEKIFLHTQAILAGGIDEVGRAGNHLREIVRLIREGGRDAQTEGHEALEELLLFIPPGALITLYSDLKEIANLLPGLSDVTQKKLDAVRLGVEIEGLEKKKFPGIFSDLFKILNDDFGEEDDELEIKAIEFHLLDDKQAYEPYIRRLRADFPEIYALHSAFFNDFLRTRDPEKMLYQRSKQIKKLKRRIGVEEEDTDSAPVETVRRSQPKVGRNDPCPCGSGKKYKHCCGA